MTKLEDTSLQNIFLEFDVIILLEAKIKGRNKRKTNRPTTKETAKILHST